MADYRALIDSPLPGVPSLGLYLAAGRLTAIDFLPTVQAPFTSAEAEPAVGLLQRYLEGEAVAASATALLQPCGTPFQQSVWQELQRIPYGSVCTYGELARRLKSSPRAVAGACRANPLPLLVPCHRVVAANGAGGYLGQTSGHGPALKQWLLQHEGYV